ncbi:viroplasmin family protein [Clostridium hydrogeniformans]|uniref:ribonuclease H1 domain-containing protein n=1 Tax=Clostridium hydrogeniformans TaxID=349933 RepID=UPI00048962F6|nr:ribonuclease H family protein [Clostridium hydrogeniformans]
MPKFYAVVKGKSGGGKIYRTWDQCRAEVIGFKGAIYKSFKNEKEALDFLELYHENKKDIKEKSSKVFESSNDNDNRVKIYVDGSYNVSTEEYSYGLVAVLNNEVIYEDKGVGEEREAASMRNVAGEVLGAMKAIEFMELNGYNGGEIYFDYQGIESWALGMWKRNNFLTQRYHEFMKKKMETLRVKFVKVKGHSGDLYNDRADRLAKNALNI